jgi:diguanylate cyclase (GGDEF)-like protein/PAS domain S-box-containing protein
VKARGLIHKVEEIIGVNEKDLTVVEGDFAVEKSPKGVKDLQNPEGQSNYEALIVENLGEGVYGINEKMQCAFINEAALNMLGYEKEEVLGADQHLLFHSSRFDGTPYPRSECPVYKIIKDGIRRETEELFKRKNGTTFPVRMTVTPMIKGNHIIGAVVNFFDISVQKSSEKYIRHLNQIYAVLAQTNQAIVQCQNEMTLFNEICRIAVNIGGMKMCWIGRPDASGKVFPLSVFGSGQSYLDQLFVSTSPDIPEGQGPFGIAFRESQTVICHNFAKDIRACVWREKAAQYGWRASASIPIVRNGQPYAVLTVYYSDENVFDQEMVDLLNEMGANISFALDRFDLAFKRAEADAQVRLYAKVFEHSREGITITDGKALIISVNQAFSKLTGYSEEEVKGQNPRILASGRHDDTFYKELWDEVNSTGHWQGEIWNKRKDGTVYAEWLSISRILDASGNVTNYIGIFGDITERKAAQDAIKEAENKYRTLFEGSQDALMTIDTETGLFGSGNPAALKLFGLSTQEELVKLNPADLSPLYQPDGQNSMTKSREMLDIAFNKGSHYFEWMHKRLDGYEFPTTVLLTNMEILGNKVVQATVRDITEQKKSEEAILQAQQLQKDIIDFLPDPTFVIDSEGAVLAWNKAIETMSGVKAKDMIGKGNYEYALPFYKSRRPVLIDFALNYNELDAEYYKSIDWRNENILVAESVADLPGGKAILWGNASVLRDSKEEVVIAIETLRDVTEQKNAEKQIQKLAYYDPLTGLPNRTLLFEQANEIISDTNYKNEPLTFMFLDLDHFKNINETLGHRVGDKLLIEIGKRLKDCIDVQDQVYRLGGDEFIIMFRNSDAEKAVQIANQLLFECTNSFDIDEHELTITASIGIAVYPDNGQDFDTLYKCADIAMYFAKQGGRNTCRFFTPTMQVRSARQLQLESALRKALERDELCVYYQPQISLEDDHSIGVEALLRWNHPEFGMVSPMEFIPMAEESGLILPIGEWVLKTAIHQMKTWLEEGLPINNMAVNLSAVQLRQKNLPQMVIQLLQEIKLPAKYLELELTESVAMKDPESAMTMMNTLHENGIRIAIDDFGTGYSSLSYLKRFRIHKLKIDQSFVRSIGRNTEDELIIEAILSLAKSLDIKTIAEGVEDNDQLSFLRERGCEEIQGYYYSKPIRAEEIRDWVNTR